MQFEYDPNKSSANLLKPGIDFESAQKLWESKTVTFVSRPGTDEIRYKTFGIIDDKHWTAITTDRGGLTRIISVRRSREEEVERYEQEH